MNQPIRPGILKKYDIDTQKMKYTLLLDMNSIMKMSLVDTRCGNNGYQYGMVFQTLLQIKMMLDKKTWDSVYAIYDGDNSGYLRYQFYKDYKANRDKKYMEHSTETQYNKYISDYVHRVMEYSRKKKTDKKNAENTSKNKYENDDENFQRQRAIIFSILEEISFRQIICEEVEGDDIIAQYVKERDSHENIVIVTSDRDLTQLVNDNVSVYIPKLKKFITPKNDKELLGCPACNILLKKQICGDSSDNIKGIKGMGETTLYKYFPKILTEKVELNYVLSESKKINEERVKAKKKPIQSLDNIVNRITEGSQGKDIFEVNKRIIDLSEPLLTEDALSEFHELKDSVIDPNGRSFENVYNIILKNKMTDLMGENHFSSFFSSFNSICEKEKSKFIKNNDK